MFPALLSVAASLVIAVSGGSVATKQRYGWRAWALLIGALVVQGVVLWSALRSANLIDAAVVGLCVVGAGSYVVVMSCWKDFTRPPVNRFPRRNGWNSRGPALRAVCYLFFAVAFLLGVWLSPSAFGYVVGSAWDLIFGGNPQLPPDWILVVLMAILADGMTLILGSHMD